MASQDWLAWSIDELRANIEQEKQNFEGHHCDGTCHDWMDEIAAKEDRLKRLELSQIV